MALPCNLNCDEIVREMDILRHARDDAQAEVDDLTAQLESLGKLVNALVAAVESNAVEIVE